MLTQLETKFPAPYCIQRNVWKVEASSTKLELKQISDETRKVERVQLRAIALQMTE